MRAAKDNQPALLARVHKAVDPIEGVAEAYRDFMTVHRDGGLNRRIFCVLLQTDLIDATRGHF